VHHPQKWESLFGKIMIESGFSHAAETPAISGPKVISIKKMPPWWRGRPRRLYSKVRQPGEGDEAAAFVRSRRGTGHTPDFGKYRRWLLFGIPMVAIQGRQDYKFVTKP
jgi:hypothetical protein